MKLFGICFLVFAVFEVTFALWSKETKEKFTKAQKECLAQPTMIRLVLGGKADIWKAQVAKYFNCLNLKMGVQKRNGDIDVDALRKQLESIYQNKTKVDKMVECGKTHGESPEDTALQLAMCSNDLLKAFETERQEKTKKYVEECQANPSTYANDAILKKFEKGEATDVENLKVGKHYLCLNLKMGFQKENGHIDIEGIKNFAQEAVPMYNELILISNCGAKRALDSPEQTAVKLNKCIFRFFAGSPHKQNF